MHFIPQRTEDLVRPEPLPDTLGHKTWSQVFHACKWSIRLFLLFFIDTTSVLELKFATIQSSRRTRQHFIWRLIHRKPPIIFVRNEESHYPHNKSKCMSRARDQSWCEVWQGASWSQLYQIDFSLCEAVPWLTFLCLLRSVFRKGKIFRRRASALRSATDQLGAFRYIISLLWASISLCIKLWFCCPLQSNLKPVTEQHYMTSSFEIIYHMNTSIISMQYKLVPFASFICPHFLCISALVTTPAFLKFKVGVGFATRAHNLKM